MNWLKNLSIGLLCAVGLSAATASGPAVAASGPSVVASGSQQANSSPPPQSENYKVLAPIDSGGVTLYPIVRLHPEANAAQWKYITLDEGLRGGEVVVTEAGKAAGLVRSRRLGRHSYDENSYNSGDQVNTLVLLNNSGRPLVLLAGEIVTGGRQDRIIAKDRIVPAHSAPLDLSVFCIEPHRWEEDSPKFGVAGHGAGNSFMVEPSVRREAMAAQDQQQVWNAVGRSIAASPSSGVVPRVGGGDQPMYDMPSAQYDRAGGTSSYAQAMAAPQVEAKIDAVAAPALDQESGMPEELRREQAVGVVAAIHGHILWADLFATPEMLEAYWPKLIRSYAAESIHQAQQDGPASSRERALRFVSDTVNGHETSEGSTGLYRYREVRGAKDALFVLQALLPATGFEVHRTLLVQSAETQSNQEYDLPDRQGPVPQIHIAPNPPSI